VQGIILTKGRSSEGVREKRQMPGWGKDVAGTDTETTREHTERESKKNLSGEELASIPAQKDADMSRLNRKGNRKNIRMGEEE